MICEKCTEIKNYIIAQLEITEADEKHLEKLMLFNTLSNILSDAELRRILYNKWVKMKGIDCTRVAKYFKEVKKTTTKEDNPVKLKKIQKKIKALLYFDGQEPKRLLFNGMIGHAKDCLDQYEKILKTPKRIPKGILYYDWDKYKADQSDILVDKVIDVFNYCLLWFVYKEIPLKDVFEKSLDRLLFKYNQFNS